MLVIMGTLVYVGGYGSGISVYSREGAHLTKLGAFDTPDPSYVIADPTGRVLYAVNELEQGSVTSYAVEPDGGLRRLSTQLTGGAEPCHLALCQGYLIAANYKSGSASVHRVGRDGVIEPASDLVQHHGHGPNPDRQEGPHAHQIHVEGDRVTIVDLGLDRLTHYRLDPAAGRLEPTGESVAAPGSGPRHIAAHPSGRWYVSCELNSTVATFEGARETAAHAATQSTKENLPSGIAVSADGRFLYVGNRGANTIATFRIDDAGGLELLGEVSTDGSWPRQFAIQDGLLYVANQKEGNVVGLRLDAGTGLPEPTGEVVEVPNASCVLLTEWAL